MPPNLQLPSRKRTAFAIPGPGARSEPMAERSVIAGPPVTLLDRVSSPLPDDDETRTASRRAVASKDLLLQATMGMADRREQADVVAYLALAHFVLGELPEGRPLTDQAVALYEVAGDGGRVIDCLLCAGRFHQRAGDLPRAIAYYERLLLRAPEVPSFVESARYNVQMSIADLHAHGLQWAEAARATLAALPLVEALGRARQPVQEATCLSQLCTYLIKQGLWAEALPHGQSALKCAQLLRDRQMEEQLHYLVATIHEELGQHREAAEHEEALLRRARAERAPRTLVLEGLVRSGMAWMRAGEDRRARTHLQEALPLIDAEGKRGLGAVVRSNLGILAEAGGEPRRAVGLFEEALRDGPPELAPLVRISLGDACLKAGLRDRAERVFAQGLELARQDGDAALVQDLAVRLADVVFAREPGRALSLYREHLAGRAPAADDAARSDELRMLERAGLACLLAEGPVTSLDYFGRMLALAREMDRPDDIARAREREAQALVQLGEPLRAEEALVDALGLLGSAGLRERAEEVRTVLAALRRETSP